MCVCALFVFCLHFSQEAEDSGALAVLMVPVNLALMWAAYTECRDPGPGGTGSAQPLFEHITDI